ncbi:hypothetical protein AB0L82_13695 [Nocardia sp. NPDC052001]|uniref:DUF6881 domain-containing protein n=1 Tax=Nocardia sp. NPDC052001 TaxID=3154853 RepID=UPI00341BB348
MQIFVEIDSDGYESRKVECFHSGGVGFAGGFTETDSTQLSDDPIESIEQHWQGPDRTLEEISPQEFQVEWLIAGGFE